MSRATSEAAAENEAETLYARCWALSSRIDKHTRATSASNDELSVDAASVKQVCVGGGEKLPPDSHALPPTRGRHPPHSSSAAPRSAPRRSLSAPPLPPRAFPAFPAAPLRALHANTRASLACRPRSPSSSSSRAGPP